jgi:hypothetical protein
MLYVERINVATRTIGVELEFTCSQCTFRSKVHAIGRGQGQGRDPFLLETGAEERASDEAYFAAHRSAREAVRLVRCPRCGERSADAWAWFWVKSGALLLFAVSLPAAVGALMTLAGNSVVGWMMAVLAPILLVGTYVFAVRPRFKTAEARVLFEPERLKHRRKREPTAAAWFIARTR